MGNPFGRIQPAGPMRPQAPPAIARDRFGNVIQRGHLVLYHNAVDMVVEVTDVAPAMDPQLQQPMMRVMLKVPEFSILVPNAQMMQHLAVCGMTEAMQQEIARRMQNGQPAAQQDEDEPMTARPSLVLTDPPEAKSGPEEGQCLSCQKWGPVGDQCECGHKYQMVL